MALLRALYGPIEKNGEACITLAFPSTLETFSTSGLLEITLGRVLEVGIGKVQDKILTPILRLLQVAQPFDFPGTPTMLKSQLY